MDTKADFQLLVLESLKYSSETESPINESPKTVISSSTSCSTSLHNNLYFYLFFIHIKQALMSILHNNSNICYWLA